MTRQAQVLERLMEAQGAWVDGTELATAQVGGSEGLKRLRELRASGYPIEERRHPDPNRSIWQYRLVPPRMMVKPPPKAARAVPGQAQAFFEEPAHALRGAAEGVGTPLDPQWTHATEIGYYDESQRLLQVPASVPPTTEFMAFPATALLRFLGKVDWIEVVDGPRWYRISKTRFEKEARVFDRAGVRHIGVLIEQWEDLSHGQRAVHEV